MSTSSSRRLLVAIGAVGAPLCFDLGDLIPPALNGPLAQQGAILAAHRTQYLLGSTLQAAGFALLGAIGVAVAMLLPRRGAVFGTIAAVLTLMGGIVMSGAILVTAFVQAAVPAAQYAAVVGPLQSDPTLGMLFDAGLVTSVGGLAAVVGLFLARPIPVWVTVLFLLGLVLANLGGGPLAAVLSLPFLVATVVIAGTLVRTAPEPAGRPVGDRPEAARV